MNDKCFFSSVTRISDLRTKPFDVQPLPREHWANGDYVVVRIDRQPRGYDRIELHNGRMAEVGIEAHVAGALGVRYATLEAVGGWEDIGSDQRMEFLTMAGLIGKATSISSMLKPLLTGEYAGHAVRGGKKLTMEDFAARVEERPYAIPTILLVGTSMSAGKTTSGKVIIRHLKRAGLKVVGAKLTGAGRYRDVLGMSDSGADEIFDFVDVGLCSSILPKEEFRAHLRALLSLIAGAEPDVVVAEAGASPLEPYNGDVVIEELGENVRCTVVCASDPYAVVGVMRGFDRKPDLVAGLATSTSAGVALVEKLTGLPALNLLSLEAQPGLARILMSCLGRLAAGPTA